jgi:hypothetical protein
MFFHANHGKWLSLEARCSYLAFFGKFFFLPLKSASFHTVSMENVRGEFSLTALAYNLRRVLNLVGFKDLLAAVAV